MERITQSCNRFKSLYPAFIICVFIKFIAGDNSFRTAPFKLSTPAYCLTMNGCGIKSSSEVRIQSGMLQIRLIQKITNSSSCMSLIFSSADMTLYLRQKDKRHKPNSLCPCKSILTCVSPKYNNRTPLPHPVTPRQRQIRKQIKAVIVIPSLTLPHRLSEKPFRPFPGKFLRIRQFRLIQPPQNS